MKRLIDSISVFIASLILVCSVPMSHGDDDVKLGAIYPLSGSVAETSSFVVEGVKMSVEEINAKGGIPIQGKKQRIELVLYDSKCDPTTGVAAAEKLINRDRVVAISGDFCSSATLAEREVANRNKIVMLNGVSVHPNICGREYPYIFRLSNTEEEVAAPFVGYVAKYLNIKTVAFLAITNDHGRSAVASHTKHYEKFKVKISAVEWLKHDDNDFYTQMTKILATKPEAVYIVTDENAQLLGTLKQLKELGFKGQILGCSSYARDDMVALAGKDLLEKMYIEGPPMDLVMGRPAVKDWWKRYEKRWGRPPMSFSLRGYDTVTVLAEALKNANTLTDREKYREAMSKSNFSDILFGFNGVPYFDELGQARQYFGVLQFQNGKRVVVYDEGKKQ
jgi:branched-chain amino acid transport system substrate-binding protein